MLNGCKLIIYSINKPLISALTPHHLSNLVVALSVCARGIVSCSDLAPLLAFCVSVVTTAHGNESRWMTYRKCQGAIRNVMRNWSCILKVIMCEGKHNWMISRLAIQSWINAFWASDQLSKYPVFFFVLFCMRISKLHPLSQFRGAFVCGFTLLWTMSITPSM